jgi:prepilin-type N-terminal cleavage/methylation domain-containing protein
MTVWRVISIDKQRGFTLMELLIAAAILAPFVIGLFHIVETMQGAYSKGEGRADLQQDARIVMARIVRELRFGGLDPSGIIPRLSIRAVIQTAEPSRIAFVGDTNGDGRSKKIEYRLDLSADRPVFRRQQWSTWTNGWSSTNGAQPLAEGIATVGFTYYGADGTAIALGQLSARLGEIRRVGIVIGAAVPSGQSPAETYRLISEVRIRNVGL